MVALQQTVYLDRVIVREVERQMVLEMKAKEKWQVLMSEDGRGWQELVHSTLLSLFSSPYFSSVTVNLQTWIWWWYLVTAAALYSLLWYFLPGWYVRLYADQPWTASTCLTLSHFLLGAASSCRFIFLRTLMSFSSSLALSGQCFSFSTVLHKTFNQKRYTAFYLAWFQFS